MARKDVLVEREKVKPSNSGALYLAALGFTFVTVWLFLLWLQDGDIALTRLLCALVFITSIIISIAVVRIGSRSDDVITSLAQVELLLSIIIVKSKRNKCDACSKMYAPSDLTVLSIGKVVCGDCAKQIDQQTEVKA